MYHHPKNPNSHHYSVWLVPAIIVLTALPHTLAFVSLPNHRKVQMVGAWLQIYSNIYNNVMQWKFVC